jgi:hypothetical protein
MTLTHSWHMGNMGSAHPLVEVNIWAKFEENPSISVGLTEWTRHSVKYFIVWYLTFIWDLDLELTHGRHGFCTSPCWGEHLSQVWRKSFNWYRIYRGDTKMKTDGETDRQTRQSETIIAPPPYNLWWEYKYARSNVFFYARIRANALFSCINICRSRSPKTFLNLLARALNATSCSYRY